ncbi:thiamine pyrophosphate-dependent enzyme, partial [Clostridioides difficile]|uniref:thiamine pyrophosphate-dependent enzyme n=1 Tax=Clostridioides difficile TaxID=1496 RepID=UPI001D3928F5
GAIKREMGSWKWTWITLGFQTLTAYIIALLINQVGSLVLGTGETMSAATRNDNVIFLVMNNNMFAMTGGQMAPTTIEGQYTAS